MRGFFLRWLLNAVALWVTSAIVGGIEVAGMGPLLGASLVLGVLNAFLRPILLLVTIPFLLLTLGLFVFVVNGLVLWITSSLVAGFHVSSFGSAVLGSLILSCVSFVLNVFLGDQGRIEYVYVERHPL